ncbi:MAG: acetyl/propionyl/methylcrotonyl-CoA carboxylase subunit alpha [Candidatus Puniceispirillaceae bacterium]
MIESILIANRGEIACRIINTARNMGIRTIAIASAEDRDARHGRMADQLILLDDGPASQNYLNISAIIEAAKHSRAQAIHPGYGFLSENPEFADAVRQAGIRFIGPSADTIRQMGLKDEAKRLMQAAGMPVVPGYLGDDQSTDRLAEEAKKIGYPVMIKARAGGGGKGMRLVTEAGAFIPALESAKREAQASFGDDHVLLEKYISEPRHIEVQILCDSHGNAVHLFERDCSLQRRHQKVIEEAPAPDMPEAIRAAMTKAAITAARSINYENAGTVEFIVDSANGLSETGFWFMEMNTRLQVEHPVTEAITGIDIVKAQIEIAAGHSLSFTQDDITITGHAVEARLYAETAEENFRPAPGIIHKLALAETAGIRIDSGIDSGDRVSPSYDPLIAKIISTAADRVTAMTRLADALNNSIIIGTDTNRAFLAHLAEHQCAEDAPLHTGVIADNLASLTQTRQPSDALVAMAAIACLPCPSNSFTGWRHWGAGEMPLSLSISGEPLKLSLLVGQDSYSLQLEDRQITLDSPLAKSGKTGRHISFVIDGQLHTGQAIWHADKLVVICDGTQASFETYSAMTTSRSNSHDGQITAPMSSVVKAVNITTGQQIKTGDVLVLVEAMKMEYPLTAPFDGIVEDISCETGDAVTDGQILMHISQQADDNDKTD